MDGVEEVTITKEGIFQKYGINSQLVTNNQLLNSLAVKNSKELGGWNGKKLYIYNLNLKYKHLIYLIGIFIDDNKYLVEGAA